MLHRCDSPGVLQCAQGRKTSRGRVPLQRGISATASKRSELSLDPSIPAGFAAVPKASESCQVRKSDLTRYSHLQCPKAEFHGMCAVAGWNWLSCGLREPFGLW